MNTKYIKICSLEISIKIICSDLLYKSINTLASGWFWQFSQKKTAVFGCLTNALAPLPIAPETVQWLKRIGQSSRLHSKKNFLYGGLRIVCE